jgi:sugar fermentation stimulation protein A
MRFPALVEGRLIRRYKRFLADVELDDGRAVTAHCPNTGAMTGCAVPGSTVWLSVSDSRTRKYPHTWELVETPAGTACVHSALANRVVREAFETGVIPGYEAWPTVTREVRYGGGSRADLLLQGPGGRVIVEVKSVTLCRDGGQGLFPDAVSDRGSKHLLALQGARDNRTRSMLVFCVFHAGVRRVSAAGDIDPRYRDTLAQAMVSGVEVMAWGADISPAGIRLTRPLPFTLDPPNPGGGADHGA